MSGFRAATATRMPSFANSLAQLELMPGPPPTISATSGKEVWVAVHTKKDAGRLGNRILREAGVE